MSRQSIARLLVALSVASLLLALTLAFGATVSFRLGGARVRSTGATRPLVVAAVSAWTAVLVGAGTTRRLAAGIGLVTATAAVALAFVRGTSPEYAVGDAAFLELYTLHATRGIWTLGPYSQFGWHHPGPLYFYLLAPLYAAGANRFAALNVGAALINFTSLAILLFVVRDVARRSLIVWIPIALGIYMLRLGPVLVSAWNPHVLALPLAALMVVSAALASGQLWLAPVAMLLGSFCVQTHVGVGGAVVALLAFAFVSNARQVLRGDIHAQAARRWLNITMWVAVACWVLPVTEELNNRPGNLSAILRFLLAQDVIHPFMHALGIWAQMMSGLLTNTLSVPVGHAMPSTPANIAIVLAAVQLGLLALVVLQPRRGDDPFGRYLCGAGLVSGIVALWSTTRIAAVIGDHHVFWMSIVGTMNWAMLAAVATGRIIERAVTWSPARIAAVCYPIFVVVMACPPVRALGLARQSADRGSRLGSEIKAAADAIEADMKDRYRLALISAGPHVWAEHGGVVLELYKRRVPIAVDAGAVFMFGKPLASSGAEHVEYVVGRTGRDAGAEEPAAEVILRRRTLTVARRPCTVHAAASPCGRSE